MPQLNTHINFNGNAQEAFNFYQSVFGGSFTKIIRFKDLPGLDAEVSEQEAQKIMHIALPVGDNILSGNDVPAFMGTVNELEHRSKIALRAQSRQEAEHLFKGLSQGGTIEMPLEDSPWGTYFAMFRDRFGIEWMIEYDVNQG
ncbi:VOC family protein [Flavobacterium sp. CYK-55]|uniref:VOC family protein n=1 Tax=Flavobacterium sp. CYK-55 TaxID=2835529 RepID=UPI001BD0ACCC|nr:VOC family protein [Flavobacterium sp. CYK-55]MBS7786326.1 VOC family protein [Flavobacterium sp. CYK-55]